MEDNEVGSEARIQYLFHITIFAKNGILYFPFFRYIALHIIVYIEDNEVGSEPKDTTTVYSHRQPIRLLSLVIGVNCLQTSLTTIIADCDNIACQRRCYYILTPCSKPYDNYRQDDLLGLLTFLERGIYRPCVSTSSF